MRSSQLLRLITVNIGIAYSFAVSYPRDDSFYGQNRAAYFQDNDSAGNSLVALRISEYDGTLSNPVKISTGGKGLAGLVAVSQDSVVVDGNVIHLCSISSHRAWGLTVYSTFSRSTQETTPSPFLQSMVVTQHIPSWLGTHCLL